jgi:hypothetical protein
MGQWPGGKLPSLTIFAAAAKLLDSLRLAIREP